MIDSRVGEGTKLPITMFVEEGTHATGPDRNADGLFTPGHDINRRIKDAWGIRDIEAGTLVAGGFEASMFKPRQRGYRVLPPDVPRPAVDNSPRSSLTNAASELGRYELRPATNVPVCAQIPPNHRDLRLMMEAQRFGPDAVPDQYRSEWLHDLVTPLAGTNPLVPYMGVRWDRDQIGGSVNLRGLEDRRSVHETEIASLRKRRSNVPAAMLALREQLCAVVDRGYGWVHAQPEKVNDPTIRGLLDKIDVDPNPPPLPSRFAYRHGAKRRLSIAVPPRTNRAPVARATSPASR